MEPSDIGCTLVSSECQGHACEIAGSDNHESVYMPEEILSVRQLQDSEDMVFLMKWKGIEEAEYVPANWAKRHYPMLVIKYYESRISWSTSNDD